MSEIKKSSVFSFFTGAGFLDLGFESQKSFEVVFSNELNPAFAAAYEHSRKALRLPLPKLGINRDSVELFHSIKSEFIKQQISDERKLDRLVGMIGGPPCPDFSIGGKNLGKFGENGRLTRDYVKVILRHKPDWFLFENVKGLYRTKRHRKFFEEMRTLLHRGGYKSSVCLVNAIDYGTPQDRSRVIMIGLHVNSFRNITSLNPEPMIPEEVINWTKQSCFDSKKVLSMDWPKTSAIGENPIFDNKLPKELTVAHWFKKNDVNNHANTSHRFKPRQGLEKFRTIEEGDVSRKSYKRLHRYRYSPTAAYGNNEVHIHPFEPRRISVAESLAIQSLPKDFELPCNMTLTDMFKTIGNGVPYLLSKGLARTVYHLIEQL